MCKVSPTPCPQSLHAPFGQCLKFCLANVNISLKKIVLGWLRFLSLRRKDLRPGFLVGSDALEGVLPWDEERDP